jgi:hypothetical protein
MNKPNAGQVKLPLFVLKPCGRGDGTCGLDEDGASVLLQPEAKKKCQGFFSELLEVIQSTFC